MWKIIFLSSRIFTCFSISSSSFLSFLSQAFEASCLEGREVPEKRKKEQFKKIVSGIVGVRLLTVLSRLFFFAGIYLEPCCGTVALEYTIQKLSLKWCHTKEFHPLTLCPNIQIKRNSSSLLKYWGARWDYAKVFIEMVPHLGGHPQTLSLDLQLNRILTANSSNERVRSRLNGYIFGWVHIAIISLISVPTFLSQFYRKYVDIIIIFSLCVLFCRNTLANCSKTKSGLKIFHRSK